MFRTGSILLLLLTFFSFSVYAQSGNQITGRVTDDEGSPLFNATVYIDNTYTGTTTDLDGKFTLSGLPAGEFDLVAKFIGYESQTKRVKVAGNAVKVEFKLVPSPIQSAEFIVEGTRAKESTPMAVQNVTKEEIEERNVGQDLPYILDMSTSVVTTSDAGAGIGYSGMRIRGSDATRVNVTVNGVPMNDAESQGTFWVNMPDFASSANSIQIQRGVGTSTNGAGAFGGSVNISTTDLQDEAYGEYNGGYGSFESWRHTVKFGSGLINDKFAFDGRLSSITSDGYIDRASSDLKSYYFSGGYYGKKSSLKFITFAGHERTYQAWNGVPQSMLDEDRTYNAYNYPDEVDDYQQTHYQLHYTQEIAKHFTFSGALHYTHGEGYFEQYKGDRYNEDLNFGSKEDLSDYGLDPIYIGGDTITQTNLIRRRWLNNDFYGVTYNFSYKKNKLDMILGGGYNIYEGDHFGEIIWAEYASNSDIYDRYYDNTATKRDFNVFLKANYQIAQKLNLFGDLQYRMVSYDASGIDADRLPISVDDQMNFVNPKAGLTYAFNSKNKVYGSFSVANREPTRNDYIDANSGTEPKHETMYDYELGYHRTHNRYGFNANLYYMDYHDQLVLTGEVNDVGSAVRENIENSYRAGVELEFGYEILRNLDLKLNATFSQNKIGDWTEKVDNWDDYTDQQVVEHSNTDIAFSPNIIGGGILSYKIPYLFFRGSGKSDLLEVALYNKYVGQQYADNTQSDDRKIDAYNLTDVRVSYSLKNLLFKEIAAYVLVRNVLDVEYESNAWVYRYYTGGQFDQLDGYFPQAGVNFMTGLQLKF